MTCDAEPAPERRPGARFSVPLLVPAPLVLALLVLVLMPIQARAQEPLFIHIRPLPQAGSAEGARAAREALWARRQAHARAVIETVCTGCLGPWKSADAVPAPPIAAQGRIADLTDPAGLETDTGSGASGPTPDSPTPERQP